MSLTAGFHKHHIQPKCMGGTDAPENLVLLHPIDHAIAHLVRFKLHGNVRDKWASNWLQGIVDPDVYTEFAIEREQGIKERRATDASFDAYMHKVRSNATACRNEGYQKAAGQAFAQRFKTDAAYAKPISENRKKANAASVAAKYKQDEERVRMVRQLRKAGHKYDEISQKTGFFISVISGIVNNKQYIGIGELDHA